MEPRARARRVTTLLFVAVCLMPSAVDAAGRLDAIRRRGAVTCGIAPGVAGFAEVDAQGHYQGLDVDVCRALSAAIFGTPDHVRFVEARSVAEFRRSRTIDIVARRLTWELRRESPLGLLFGPITFYDGQGFLVSKRLGISTARQLSGQTLCVADGTTFFINATAYFNANRLVLKSVPLDSADDFALARSALADGRCDAYTADVSELGAIHSGLPRPDDFEILQETISKEPLAPLVRDDDAPFFDVVRWTVFALIEAEELGITSTNAEAMRASEDVTVRRFLGVIPGNGKALGLDEAWAYNVVRTLGNYGELFERNVGRGSRIGLDRGLNRLWNAGGLMFAPPLR